MVDAAICTTSLGPRYFLAGVIGYGVGLLATFVPATQFQQNRRAGTEGAQQSSRSLYLMQHGQPALLFLVPGTLAPGLVTQQLGSRAWLAWLLPVTTCDSRDCSPFPDDRSRTPTEIPTCFIALRKAWLPDESPFVKSPQAAFRAS